MKNLKKNTNIFIGNIFLKYKCNCKQFKGRKKVRMYG